MSSESLSLPEPLVAALREHDAGADDFDEAQLSFILNRKKEQCGKIRRRGKGHLCGDRGSIFVSLWWPAEKSLGNSLLPSP